MLWYRLIGHASELFKNLVQIGKRIEDGLKTANIKDYQTLFNQSSNRVGELSEKTFLKRKSDKSQTEVHTISGHAARHQHFYAHPRSYLIAICTTSCTSNLSQFCYISVANTCHSHGQHQRGQPTKCHSIASFIELLHKPLNTNL